MAGVWSREVVRVLPITSVCLYPVSNNPLEWDKVYITLVSMEYKLCSMVLLMCKVIGQDNEQNSLLEIKL